MPNLTQSWVGYLTRSYQQIKQSVITRLVANNPEITDHTESNILIIIISIFSGIAEMLNLYIDRMAQEAFIGTAQRYSSVVKLARLVDYRPKAAVPATVDLTFTLVDQITGLPVTPILPLLIPNGTLLTTSGGIEFYTTTDITIPIGGSMAQVSAIQQTYYLTNLGVNNFIPNEAFVLPNGYVHGSLTMYDFADIYKPIDSFGLALSTDQVIVVEIREDGIAYMVVGDGVNGTMPSALSLDGDMQITTGELGNVPPNSITTLSSVVTVPVGTKLLVTNPNYAANGYGYENIEDIRKLAPLSVRTLYRAVTKQDYIDLALLAPGVGLADVKYCCGECVRVYIGPKTRGVASGLLLTQVLAYFQCKKMLGRCVKVLPAGITRVWLKLTIQPTYGVSNVAIQNEFANVMENNFGYLASDVNRQINISDIIGKIENSTLVAYVTLEEIWAEPYARNTTGIIPLNWTPIILPGSIVENSWKLIYDSILGEFSVLLNNTYIGLASIGTPFTDPSGIATFTINPSSYINGDEYEFITYPYNQSIILTDNSIPIVDVDFTTNPYTGFYNLTIAKNTLQNNCNPTC